MNIVKDAKGKELKVSDWLFRMAKDYGWTSDVLDADFANAIERGRNDYSDDSRYFVWQSIGKSMESWNAMAIVRGEEKPGFDGVYSGVWYAGGGF